MRPATVADMMISVSGFLDLSEKAFTALARIRGIEEPEFGTTMQADLHMLAAWLREHPEVDAQMMAVVDAYPGT
jgi:hypothetical protein